MKIIIAAFNLVAISGIAFWLWKRQPTSLKFVFLPALIGKLSAGIALGLVYLYYYPIGDTFSLFDQSAELTDRFYHDPSEYVNILFASGGGEYLGHLRSLFFIKVISVINIFSFNNYWITGLWLSLVTFLCAWHLFKKIVSAFEGAHTAAAFAFLFLPSVLFWSAGIIKESIALAALFLLAAVWIDCMKENMPRAGSILLTVLSLWVVWKLKYYWAAIFIPVVLASIIIRRITFRSERLSLLTFFFGAVLAILLFYGVTFVHPNFDPDSFLTVLVDNHNAYARLSGTENGIHFYNLRPAWTSIIINSPWALFSGLFRPFITESTNVLSFAAALENLVVLILFLSALAGKPWRPSDNRAMGAAVIIYVALLSIFLALSTPNFGSLARYKLGFTPFFVFVITYRNPLVDRVLKKIQKQKIT